MLRANIIRHGRVLEAAIEFLWVVVFVCKVTFVLSPTAVEAELGLSLDQMFFWTLSFKKDELLSH